MPKNGHCVIISRLGVVVKFAVLCTGKLIAVLVIDDPIFHLFAVILLIGEYDRYDSVMQICLGTVIAVYKTAFGCCYDGNRNRLKTIIAAVITVFIGAFAKSCSTYITKMVLDGVMTYRKCCLTHIAIMVAVLVFASAYGFSAFIAKVIVGRHIYAGTHLFAAYFTEMIVGLLVYTRTAAFVTYITLVVSGRIIAFGQHTVTVIAFVISVLIIAIQHGKTAPIANVIDVEIITTSVLNTANVAYVVLFFVHGALT